MSKISNYTILSEQTSSTWNGQTITRKLQKANGEIIIRKTEQKTDVAVVLGLTSDNYVICIKQFRFGPMQLQTELPAGKIERGEDPISAVSREFLEETGYTGEFEYVCKSLSSPSSNNYRHIFVCKNAVQVAAQTLTEFEDIEIEILNLDEFKKSAMRGKIFPIDAALMGLIHLKLLK